MHAHYIPHTLTAIQHPKRTNANSACIAFMLKFQSAVD
jgi:hypothetical protein